MTEREKDSLLSVRHRQDGRKRERESERERDSLLSVLGTDRMAQREREQQRKRESGARLPALTLHFSRCVLSM